MPHVLQRFVCVGLDVQLEGFLHRFEGDRGAAVGNGGAGAVAAVAALLGPDVRLGHVGHLAGDRADRELLLHVRVALTGASRVRDVVEALVETEGLCEAGECADADRLVDAARDEDALRSAFVQVFHEVLGDAVLHLRNHLVS